MFQTMMESIREESIGYLFNLEVQVQQPAEVSAPGVADARAAAGPQITAAGLEAPQRPASLQFTAPTASGEAETRVERQNSAKTADSAKDKRPAKSGKRRK